MARRTHIIDGNFNSNGLSPSELTAQEFARRLYRLMLNKGWTQAELARQSGVSRDGVSGYIRGNHMPTHEKAAALAKALGVKTDELLPNFTGDAIEADSPSIDIKVSTSDPSRAWLRVNRLVTTETAGEVIQLLSNDAKKLSSGARK